MHPRYLSIVVALASFALLGCDDSDGQPCILDSDCPDFNEVCIDERCQPRGGLQPDGGTSLDGGPGSDGGPSVDGGAGMDGAVLDAAMADDGGIVDGAVPIDGEACPDLSGTWEVSFVNAETSCGGAAVGRASDLSLSGACTFTASSQEPGAPAIDGTLVVRADETFDPAATAVATGTAEPVSCTGMVDAADSAITLSCNACVMNLARP